MKTKNLSKLLVFGILLNSIPINAFASVLSEDIRYETFTDNNISIPNVLEEDKVDVKLEGDTLINIYPNKGEWISDTPEIAFNRGNILIDNSLWKENTTYTVKLVGLNINKITHMFFDGISNQPVINGSTFTTSPKTEWRSSFLHIYGSNFTSNDFNDLKVLVFEGDITQNLPNKYFEGLKSSFEDQLITQEMVNNGQEKAENLGKYKVEYKVTGKNIFSGELERGYGYPHTGITASGYQEFLRGTTLIPVKENTYYTISFEDPDNYVLPHQYGFLCFNADKKLFANYGYSGKIPVGTKYILPTFKTNQNPAPLDAIKNIQIEEGAIATEYEPYKESTKIFYLNSPLLEGDTIEYINKKATHVHRYGKTILNGSEEWIERANSGSYGYALDYSLLYLSDEYARTINMKNSTLNPGSIYSYSDRFKSLSRNDGWNIKYQGEYIHNECISIKNSRLSSLDLNGFKQWLRNNPVTVIYELKNPIYEPIKTDLSVNLFEGTTHLSNNSNVPANMKIIVDRTLNRAVEAIELAKTNPTIENLSKARYWNNLLKDSTRKEQLQEEVDSITNISDMVLDRKLATSNLDVYIKSENILQMSLDTNSISFDDFSGIEDVVKENAVNITINSSLPYQINAYLPAEIQNSDKSATMDKSILNIKESGESNYQTFVNTTDKIVLKDNCSAGNYLTHGVDLKLAGGIAHEKDVYKATIKLEAEQK